MRQGSGLQSAPFRALPVQGLPSGLAHRGGRAAGRHRFERLAREETVAAADGFHGLRLLPLAEGARASAAPSGPSPATVTLCALGSGVREAFQAEQIVRLRKAGVPLSERWRRAARNGALRAAIFGVNDGLVSNLALIMGVAGAQPGRQVILLAELAGLLAGVFSMGAGEYVSMRVQSEVGERVLAVERREIEVDPEGEQRELAAIYEARGFSPELAPADCRRGDEQAGPCAGDPCPRRAGDRRGEPRIPGGRRCRSSPSPWAPPSPAPLPIGIPALRPGSEPLSPWPRSSSWEPRPVS